MNPAPFNGTVYGVLLNFQAERDALGERMSQPPYLAPPRAPVLYIKPANTWSACGAAIAVPDHVPEVEIGASVGLVMGPAGQLAGCVLVNDLSVPHESFYRPPVKYKCLDGFLGVGDTLVSTDPDTLVLDVRINGETRQRVDFRGTVRHSAALLADVNGFMTLHAGDVLLLGCGTGRPLARVGDRIEITAPGFPPLVNTLVREEPTAGPPQGGLSPLGGQRAAQRRSVGASAP